MEEASRDEKGEGEGEGEGENLICEGVGIL